VAAKTDRTISPPEGPGVGQPPASRLADIALTEIAKLQNDGEYTRRDLGELKTDMRDLRDRMTRLEVRVDHLPSKGFIVVVAIAALTLIGGLLSISPKLQTWAGTSPGISGSP
jgi:hypothetical protein